MAPCALDPGLMDASSPPPFLVPNKKTRRLGGCEAQTTKPFLHALRGMTHPRFVVKPSRCCCVFDVPPSLDAFESFALPPDGQHTWLCHRPIRLGRRYLYHHVFLLVHASYEPSVTRLHLEYLGPSVQANLHSPRTFRLIFTSHRRPSHRILQLQFKGKRYAHNGFQSLTVREWPTTIGPHFTRASILVTYILKNTRSNMVTEQSAKKSYNKIW